MVHYFYQLDYTATIASNTSSSNTPGTNFASEDPPVLKGKGFRHLATLSTARTSACRFCDGDMVMHAKVFAAAVKYQVAALCKLAAKKFTDAVELNLSLIHI